MRYFLDHKRKAFQGGAGVSWDMTISNAYIRTQSEPSLTFGDSVTDSPFSMGIWLYKSSWTGGCRILMNYDAPYQYGFFANNSAQLIMVLLDNGTSPRIGRLYSSAMTAYDGLWIHVVGTYDGSSSSSGIKIYINGSRVDDTDYNSGSYVAMHGGNSRLYLGLAATFDFTPYAGYMADWILWNKELSAAEVAQIYNSGVPRDEMSESTSANIIHYWRANTGGVLPTDLSPTGADANFESNVALSTNYPT